MPCKTTLGFWLGGSIFYQTFLFGGGAKLKKKEKLDILFVGPCNSVSDLEDAVAYLTPFLEKGVRVNLVASRLDSGEAGTERKPVL